MATEDCEAVPLQEYLAAVRESDLRFEAERDRRYTEVNLEREKALKIKETADLAALELARIDQRQDIGPLAPEFQPAPKKCPRPNQARPSRRAR